MSHPVFSPLMPDQASQMAADTAAGPIAKLKAKCPINVLLNGTEYGLGIWGLEGLDWKKDPNVLTAIGGLANWNTFDWNTFLSQKKQRQEQFITDACIAASGGDASFLYFLPGDESRETGTRSLLSTTIGGTGAWTITTTANYPTDFAVCNGITVAVNVANTNMAAIFGVSSAIYTSSTNKLNLIGTGPAGATVTASLGGVTLGTVTVGANNSWILAATSPSPVPRTISVTCNGATLPIDVTGANGLPAFGISSASYNISTAKTTISGVGPAGASLVIYIAGSHWAWAFDYSYMRTVSTYPSYQAFYQADGVWAPNPADTTQTNPLTKLLDASAYAIEFNQPLSYHWLCAGWLTIAMNRLNDFISGINPGSYSDDSAGGQALFNDMITFAGTNITMVGYANKFYVSGMTPTDLKNAMLTYFQARFSPDDRYLGFLKCAYTSGMISGIAGYFSYPQEGFSGKVGPTAPDWLRQIILLSQAHGLFSYVDDFITNGDLLPGPNKHIWEMELPAYEFPTGEANLTSRVLVRKHHTKNAWLICAWAASGADRNVTVTIPTLGSVTLLARAAGSVYLATPGPRLTLLDTDAMNPTNGIVDRLAPVFLPIDNKIINQNLLLSFNISATDPAGGTITYSAIGLPAGATLVGNTFSWTPSLSQVGDYILTFLASNGTLTTTETVTITVITADKPTVLAPISNQTVTQATTLTLALSATDPDADPITYSATGMPSGATLNGNIFSWTPNYAQAGIYNITFKASDGLLTASQNAAITVIKVNMPPSLSSIGNKTIAEGSTLTITLSATDPNADPITYSATGMPSGATLNGNIFSWTPNYTQAGTYNVTFTASDGLLTSSQSTTIVVNNTDRPPVFSSIGNKTVVAGTLLTITLSATDPDGYAITYSATGMPIGAILNANIFSWTPSLTQVGSYSVTFKASDGALAASQTITITVSKPKGNAGGRFKNSAR